MKLEQVFNNVTTTTNGDIAYISSGNKYMDIIFKVLEGRLSDTPLFNGILSSSSKYDKLFSMFIRDPRYGVGERKVGRELFYDIKLEPELIFLSGRADDIFYVGYWYQKKELRKDFKGTNPYWDFLYNALTSPKKETFHNVTKWMPRYRGSKNKLMVALFLKKYKITPKEYRKLIVNNNTVEATLSRHDKIKDYSTVPSLAMLKYFEAFKRKDSHRFEMYLDEVKSGKVKLNAKTSDPVKVFEKDLKDKDIQILWDALPKLEPMSILCIVDQSGSMLDCNKSYIKARAIGTYVSQSSSYLPNKIITFSSNPKLLDIGNTVSSAKKTFNSYHDASTTDLGRVFEILSTVTEDLPEYLLILSDMQFDEGSSMKKEKCMKLFKEKGINTKIVWWNLNIKNSTFPETDNYGNIFLSGYSPRILSFLSSKFNSDNYIDNLLRDYLSKIYPEGNNK